MTKRGKIRLFVIISLIIILLPVIFIIAIFNGKFGHIQSRAELLSYKNANASVVLSEEGELIGKFYSENRTNISYDRIPPYLIDALIATEDVRFFRHRGIDARSLARVLVKSILLNRNKGGGSTISQQLAKSMFGREDFGRFTLFINKTKEAILASRLERILSKEDILTLYLNTVPFGENIFGIEAAARRYFNKKVEDLNIEESAVLIGMLKANNFYNPRLHPENARGRRNVVISQMKKYNFLEPDKADSISELPLVQNYVNFELKGPADYFLYQLKIEAEQILSNIETETGKKWNIEEDGLVVSTTLNLSLQNYANESFRDHMTVMQKKLNDQYETSSGKRILNELTKKELKRLNMTQRAKEPSLQEDFDANDSLTTVISVSDSIKHALRVLQAGLMAMDPVTGEIRAWVGGIDFKTQPYDQVLARRQLASTFKPIIYAAAIEDGLEPCYYLDNDSIILSGYEDWTPENFDHTYGGQYSLAGALSHSVNVPTFNLFMKIGFYKLDSLWRNMGFSYNLIYNPSLALGTAEASLKEVSIAYSSFANGGYKISPHSITSIKTHDGDTIWEYKSTTRKKRIMTEKTASLMSAMLQKAVNEGTGAPLRYTYGVQIPMAGKTGTSQDYADAWFAAFNPKLVIVSRVGASYPSIHFNNGRNGSGTSLALPLVAMTMKKAQLDTALVKEIRAPFPSLPPELADALNCPDFKEEGLIDKFRDFFKRDEIIFNKPPAIDKPVERNNQEKKSIFRRIFRKRR